MSNRVEHQKQNQPAIENWPFGFVFGVQLGLRQTPVLIITYNIFIIITELHEHNELIERREAEEKKLNVLRELSDDNNDVIGCNSACVCRRPS